MTTETFIDGGILATGINGEVLASNGSAVREIYIGGAVLPVDESGRLVVSGAGVNAGVPDASSISTSDGRTVQEYLDDMAASLSTLQGGGLAVPSLGDIRIGLEARPGEIEIDEFMAYSKTEYAALYEYLLTVRPNNVREIDAEHFGFIF